MGLIACRECGAKISKSAPICPHCGAPKRKKTTRLTWLILILLILIVIGYQNDYDEIEGEVTTSKSSKEVPNNSTSVPAETANKTKKQGWRVRRSEDSMSGAEQVYAISPRVASVKRMKFPYTGTKAWLGFGCTVDSEWLYVGFNNAPNLTNTEAKSGGYNTFSTRVRWDSKIEVEDFYQDWGSEFIEFLDTEDAIQKVSQSESMRLELRWHGEGTSHFDFNLNGSSKAISKARKACK